jgi:aquaporin Z
MQKYTVEAIGAFFLVLTIALSANPLAIGIVLSVLVYMGGYISGAHYNPAVTLAVFLQKKIAGKDAIFYVLSQFIGALIATVVFAFIQHKNFIVQPGQDYTFLQALLSEILFTFILCSVVLHTAVSKENTPNQFFGLAIGGAVMVGAFSVGTISGAAFNPAVGLSPVFANVFTIQQHVPLVGLYLLGPVIGAILSSFIFTFTTSGKK